MWSSIWNYILQNVLPPSFWTLTGLAYGYVRTHRKLDAQHEALKQHVTSATGGGGSAER